jgi:hypothetical protein
MLTLRAEDTNASLTHLVAQSVMLARRTEPSSAGRTRTYNHLVNSQTHFQLCYHRSLFPRREVANVGFEPTNSRVRHYPKPARCVPLSPISLLYSIISSIVPFVNTFLPKVDKKIKKMSYRVSMTLHEGRERYLSGSNRPPVFYKKTALPDELRYLNHSFSFLSSMNLWMT